jgi:hypothetical protein
MTTTTANRAHAEALANLRHVYSNLVNGGVKDASSAKRIAEGLLAPAIEALERSHTRAVPVACRGCDDGAALNKFGQHCYDDGVRFFCTNPPYPIAPTHQG